jgi:hypothetical protein
MKAGIRLAAKNCFGEIVIGGQKPRVAGKNYSIDVYFTAYCPGSSVGISGVLPGFTGFDTGCYGDTASIAKPPCKASKLRVVVDRVELAR